MPRGTGNTKRLNYTRTYLRFRLIFHEFFIPRKRDHLSTTRKRDAAREFSNSFAQFSLCRDSRVSSGPFGENVDKHLFTLTSRQASSADRMTHRYRCASRGGSILKLRDADQWFSTRGFNWSAESLSAKSSGFRYTRATCTRKPGHRGSCNWTTNCGAFIPSARVKNSVELKFR